MEEKDAERKRQAEEAEQKRVQDLELQRAEEKEQRRLKKEQKLKQKEEAVAQTNAPRYKVKENTQPLEEVKEAKPKKEKIPKE